MVTSSIFLVRILKVDGVDALGMFKNVFLGRGKDRRQE